MRTTIESVSFGRPEIFAGCILEEDEQAVMGAFDGGLEAIAADAQAAGRLTCGAAECGLEAIAQPTGDKDSHQIDIACTRGQGSCRNNLLAVCSSFDKVCELALARGVIAKPIEDFDNLQSWPENI